MKRVIGLTGGSGSGKSVISAYLKSLGAHIVDADTIAHGVYKKGKPAYTEIIQYFGVDILDEQQEIHRRALGNIVFSDNEKLEFLNNCTYHYIYQEVKEQITKYQLADCRTEIIVLDAPLFNETLKQLCNEVWVVFASKEVRVKRIVSRDNITTLQAEKRLNSQSDFLEYSKFAFHILDNSGDLNDLISQVNELLSKPYASTPVDFRKNSIKNRK